MLSRPSHLILKHVDFATSKEINAVLGPQIQDSHKKLKQNSNLLRQLPTHAWFQLAHKVTRKSLCQQIYSSFTFQFQNLSKSFKWKICQSQTSILFQMISPKTSVRTPRSMESGQSGSQRPYKRTFETCLFCSLINLKRKFEDLKERLFSAFYSLPSPRLGFIDDDFCASLYLSIN